MCGGVAFLFLLYVRGRGSPSSRFPLHLTFQLNYWSFFKIFYFHVVPGEDWLVCPALNIDRLAPRNKINGSCFSLPNPCWYCQKEAWWYRLFGADTKTHINNIVNRATCRIIFIQTFISKLSINFSTLWLFSLVESNKAKKVKKWNILLCW